ncbi:gamma-glutamylcyclotransferase family protein [Methanolobus sp. ZRKC3]|uniref:gamma-glutamylcyclotransferase family protein n=1 Tax=Methanolobus sp. ZRKC3 TaxID=3125786 RepID=UPI0032442DC8
MYVFVYGSLKKGFCNHPLIEGSEFICETHTKESYAMLDLHRFPGVIKDKKISIIYGEVYDPEDTVLEQLDIFEGSWYTRENVELDAGFPAQMYFLKRIPEKPGYSRIINEGIWTEKQHME